MAVNEDGAMLDIMEQMLKRLGYQILKAQDEKQALQIFQQNADEINLVIVDLNLSQIKSDQIVDQLKKIRPHVKVLIAGDHTHDQAQTQALRQKASGFLQKPFNVMQLSRKLSTATP
jgi:DNA-binding NtrC family response regulator